LIDDVSFFGLFKSKFCESLKYFSYQNIEYLINLYEVSEDHKDQEGVESGSFTEVLMFKECKDHSN